MDKALRKLEGLLSNAVNLGERIRLEGAVYRAELSERQKLGLTGDAAVKHYNDYGSHYLSCNRLRGSVGYPLQRY